MKCFYHRPDLDGKCSGAIVRKKFPEVELISINYGDDWQEHRAKLVPGEVVYMVDFSLLPEDMKELNEVCELHWIDHHATALEEADAWGFKASGGQLCRIGTAACELVWEYLYPAEDIPITVKYLSYYDVWNLGMLDLVLPLQYGMNMYPNKPTNDGLWKPLLSTDPRTQTAMHAKIYNEGLLLQKYVEREFDTYARAFAFEMEWEGLKFVACNRGLTGSKLFKTCWDPKKYHAMLVFTQARNGWTVSLYTDDPDSTTDVSVIAKKYGGGGHRGAAGFTCIKLPFQDQLNTDLKSPYPYKPKSKEEEDV